MYHLTGDETQAVLTWCVGTALAAAVAALRAADHRRGRACRCLAVPARVGLLARHRFPYAFMVIAAVLWLVSYWTGSAASRHLILLSLIFYVALLAVEHDSGLIAIAAVLAAVSAALFALAVVMPAEVERSSGWAACCRSTA